MKLWSTIDGRRSRRPSGVACAIRRTRTMLGRDRRDRRRVRDGSLPGPGDCRRSCVACPVNSGHMNAFVIFCEHLCSYRKMAVVPGCPLAKKVLYSLCSRGITRELLIRRSRVRAPAPSLQKAPGYTGLFSCAAKLCRSLLRSMSLKSHHTDEFHSFVGSVALIEQHWLKTWVVH